LPDYEITQELGRGAMGVVYLGATERLTVWPSSRNCLLRCRRQRSGTVLD